MPLMGCQKTRVIDQCYTPVPFRFNEATNIWLKQCEAQIEPPIQAIVDFDRLQKKYKMDKKYYEESIQR